MRRMLIACAAALLWAQSAGAVTEPKDPRDEQGAPVLPAGPTTRPPLAETPQRQAMPLRQAKQEEIRRDLEQWRERVERWRREHEAYGGKAEAARLVDALRIAEQSWRRLAESTTGAGWDRSMNQLERAREQLQRAWRDANS